MHIIYRPNRRLSYQERISRHRVAASPVLGHVVERLFGRLLLRGDSLSCRKICKWGPLSDTCRLIFAARTAGAAGRCPASRPGPSEMPRDPNKGFCRTPAIRRAGHQDVAFLRMCRTRTLSRSPSRIISFSLPLSYSPLRLFSPGFAIRAFGVFALPPGLSLYLSARPNCGSRRTANSSRVRMLSC